jgi:hypothetical protein
MLFAALLGWLEREQRDVIAFLREENRALKAQLAGRRLKLNEAQRRGDQADPACSQRFGVWSFGWRQIIRAGATRAFRGH